MHFCPLIKIAASRITFVQIKSGWLLLKKTDISFRFVLISCHLDFFRTVAAATLFLTCLPRDTAGAWSDHVSLLRLIRLIAKSTKHLHLLALVK